MTSTLDPWELVAQRFEPRPDYANDPVRWLSERIGEEAWSTQRQIMQALVEQRMVAVPSCHGVGKSHIASRIAAWWVDVHGGEDPTEVFLVTTAPTASQVSAVLWRYIGQVHRAGKLPGKINRSPYPSWILEGDLVGFGRKPADYEESAFQGIHATWTLIIVDEACGVMPGLWDQLASLASNINGRILAIGNPTDPATFFHRICQPDSDYHTIWIDALRTPNFNEQQLVDYPLTRLLMQALNIPPSTEPISPELSQKLVSPLYCEERIRSYCGFTKTSHLTDDIDQLKDDLVRRTNNSPMFLARVRGVFPTNASDGVIPLGWIQQAVQRWHDWEAAGMPDPLGRRVIGVDVARYGEDETVLVIRQGNIVQKMLVRAQQDTVETADDVHPWLNWPGALGVIDVNGVGAGVFDVLRRRKQESKIQGTPIPFNASSRTQRKDLIGEFVFRTDRDASWWRMREMLDPSKGSLLALPDDEMLTVELSSVKYKVLTGGVIVVESKDEIKKRIRRSTDRADAVIQSIWVDGLPVDWDPSDQVVSQTKGGVVQYEGYDSDWSELFDQNVLQRGWET